MKKLYILIFSFLFILGFSQTYSILLSNVTWKIVKIQSNNVDYYPPAPLSANGWIKFNDPETNRFTGNFFNSVIGDMVWGENNINNFRVTSSAVTLMSYGGENKVAVNQFDEMANSFYMSFPTTANFTFDYEEILSGRNLVVTNPAGNKIFYSNLILGTAEALKSKISIYPNPATEIVIVENLKPNSSLELIDNSGKLVKSISNIKTTKTEINIKNLSSGIYYLKVDSQSIHKIIKK